MKYYREFLITRPASSATRQPKKVRVASYYDVAQKRFDQLVEESKSVK